MLAYEKHDLPKSHVSVGDWFVFHESHGSLKLLFLLFRGQAVILQDACEGTGGTPLVGEPWVAGHSGQGVLGGVVAVGRGANGAGKPWNFTHRHRHPGLKGAGGPACHPWQLQQSSWSKEGVD